jgi:hypothetical protein
VFALKLNRKKLAKNSAGSVQLKLLIARPGEAHGCALIRNHKAAPPETCCSPFALMSTVIAAENPIETWPLAAGVNGLSFRLMSL